MSVQMRFCHTGRRRICIVSSRMCGFCVWLPQRCKSQDDGVVKPLGKPSVQPGGVAAGGHRHHVLAAYDERRTGAALLLAVAAAHRLCHRLAHSTSVIVGGGPASMHQDIEIKNTFHMQLSHAADSATVADDIGSGLDHSLLLWGGRAL